MHNHYTDDGRVLTPPNELEPLLKGSFPAFFKLIGHIRFFYMADEIWDGKSSLMFKADGKQLIAIMFDDGIFNAHIADKDFKITDETLLDTVFVTLKEIIPSCWCRPFEQLTINLKNSNEYPCGYRCDMCLINKKHNENDFSGSEKFDYTNWLYYHHCLEGIDMDLEKNKYTKAVCQGGDESRINGCKIWTEQSLYIISTK